MVTLPRILGRSPHMLCQPQGDSDQQVVEGGIPLVHRPVPGVSDPYCCQLYRTYIPDVSMTMKDIAVSSMSRMMTSLRFVGVIDATARSVELGVNDIRILVPVIDTDPHLPTD